MWSWLLDLDKILRGEATRVSDLREGGLPFSARKLSLTLLVLGAFYGLCMGSYTLTQGGTDPLLRMISSAIKVPLLFLFTLIITFPSLYVFNALVGSKLSLISMLRLLVASIAVNLAVLASFGTIVVFFSISTYNYNFMVLLNVTVFALSGAMGLKFLLETLHRLTKSLVAEPLVEDLPMEEAVKPQRPPGALDRPYGERTDRDVTIVFRIWVTVYGLVGAQLGWVLRPFLGDPSLPFEWFRNRQSNFFEAVLNHLMALFS